MPAEISFGIWLRRQRRALDLSRQGFADQVGCAEVTLRRIEAGTLKPSRELAGILLEKIGVPETERPQWISFARGLSALPLSSTPPSNKPATNLPAPLTTFIGREKEQSDVTRLITKHRLVTLTGAGGVGKTRLSLRAGEHGLGNYPAGVWFVELAPILDPLLVPRTTAIAIGLRDEPQRPVIDMLSDYLREKQILIILDNCEHLVDACAQLADTLLKHCPNLKILATSREALGVLGEALYPVPSLELPDFRQLVEKFRDYDSVRLFEERAQLARMDFSLTIENAPSIAKICSRLDGIPLAIELAAARVKMLSIEQIAEKLQESLSLLTIGNRTALPRHQTLQAAIDWSYELLTPAEQTLFRRLSVFVNGWKLEAAEFICSDVNVKPESILDLLNQLIDKSLVVSQEEHGRTRYRILETTRQYAHEKLIHGGESEALRDRHLEYFLNLAGTAEPYLIRTEQIEWLPLLDADYENLRFALEWSLNKETAGPSLNLCKALGWFWAIRGYWLEGLSWTTRALAKPSQDENKSEKIARARALYTRIQLDLQLGNVEQLRASYAEASLALTADVLDKKDIAITRLCVGIALEFRGELDKSCIVMEQSFIEFQQLNDFFWQARSFDRLSMLLSRLNRLRYSDVLLKNLQLTREAGERLTWADALSSYADWLFRIGREQDAREHAEQAEKLYKQIGSQNSSIIPSMFAYLAWGNGEYQKARSLFMELEERCSLLGDKWTRALVLRELGRLAMAEDDLERAQIYLEQALELSRETRQTALTAYCLFDLSILFYRQGKVEDSQQNAREGLYLTMKKRFAESHKHYALMTVLGLVYFQKPETAVRLLGVVEANNKQDFFLPAPVDKQYCVLAKRYARKTLGDAALESALAEGEEMSLDDALELVVKTVEEM